MLAGFDVPVNDPLLVRRIQRVGDLDRHVEQRLNLERLPLDQVPEGLPFQQLHGNEWLAFVLADLVDRADVGMVEGRGSLCLPLEPFQCLVIFGKFPRQELERHEAMELHVFSFVHHAHAPGTKLFEDAVVGNGFAEHGVEVW